VLEAVCSACQRPFPVRFAYQHEGSSYYCSITCRAPRSEQTCDSCGNGFELEFAYQLVDRKLACSEACREALLARRKREPRVIAVLNQKGGTGKTTTAVSVAAGLSQRGLRTLLVDLDAQGNVGVSFGIAPKQNLYHVLIEELAPAEAVVSVRRDLDVLACDQAMAAAELELVDLSQAKSAASGDGRKGVARAAPMDRSRVLAKRLRPLVTSGKYDYVLLDCGPSLSLLNQNALTFAREVLIPVSCDYLALVGVKQILRTIRHVNDVLLHEVDVLGVVPTFFDSRNKISKQAVDALATYFKDRVFPPVHVNARLKEAPSHDKTIFEYAPESRGAQDYLAVVERIATS
jgi:chromosome partitioning protein